MSDSNNEIQLVTFKLGQETYGIDIMDVKEIVKIQEIRAIPGAPPYVSGILNLRGTIIPIINLHRRFNLKKLDTDENEKLLRGIIVININDKLIGIIIDRVSRVISVETGTIKPPPQIISGIGAEYIDGVVNNEEGYLIILDIKRLFSKTELQQLHSISE
ncbi:MAG: purine-binding chemotaxis protein CheW [Spirochaetales bacterium]|nr:purine-binding chemotaxis protein CheW [Spirochaetales bacterium]RKX84750.1 MAG: chemotaxis protein CheW [Spirochaetota bacterium]